VTEGKVSSIERFTEGLCRSVKHYFNIIISLLNSKYLSVFCDIKPQSTSSGSLHFLQHHKAEIIPPKYIQELVFVFIYTQVATFSDIGIVQIYTTQYNPTVHNKHTVDTLNCYHRTKEITIKYYSRKTVKYVQK
jgi:hypothetical protein